MTMFERYSERARRTIFHARYEALARFSREIEPRDIILGLTRDEHQPGCPFASLYERAGEIRSLFNMEAVVYGAAENRDIPLSKTSKISLAYAAVECEDDGRRTIGSQHLLRGVLRADDNIASKLADLGYTLSSMRKASHQLYRSTPDAAASVRWRLEAIGRRMKR